MQISFEGPFRETHDQGFSQFEEAAWLAFD